MVLLEKLSSLCLWFSIGPMGGRCAHSSPITSHSQEGTAGKVEDLGLYCLASALFSRRRLRDSSSDSAVRFFPTACLVLPSLARLGPLLQLSPALAHGSMKRGVVEVVAAAAAGRRQEQEERRWRRRWWWRRRWLGWKVIGVGKRLRVKERKGARCQDLLGQPRPWGRGGQRQAQSVARL